MDLYKSVAGRRALITGAFSGLGEHFAKTLAAHGAIVDDFSVGYSSVSYLRHISRSRLKIDMSFVEDLVMDKRCLPNFFFGRCG